jgi:hypothetical protein
MHATYFVCCSKIQFTVAWFCQNFSSLWLGFVRTQTTIDILVRHAYDSVGRFTARQREAMEKLWNSIKEQQIRRKHGKSTSEKLDVNAFEQLQEKSMQKR